MLNKSLSGGWLLLSPHLQLHLSKGTNVGRFVGRQRSGGWRRRWVWLQLRQPIAIGNYCSPMLCKQPSFCTRCRSHFDIWVHIGSKWQPGEEWKGQGLIRCPNDFPLQRRRIGDHLNPDTTFFCFFATRPLEWKPYPPTTVCEKEFICSIPSLPPMLSPPPLALSVHICLGHLQLGRSCMHGARMIDF